MAARGEHDDAVLASADGEAPLSPGPRVRLPRMRRRFWVRVLVGLAVVRLLVSAALIWTYTLGRGHEDYRTYNSEERQHHGQCYYRLRSIWQARGERDVGAEVIPFLTDPLVSVRDRAVYVAGRLESPVTAGPLSRVRRVDEGSGHRPIERHEVALALARVRTHGSRGLLRLHWVVGSVWLTLPDLWVLAWRVNASRRAFYGPRNSIGDDIVWEMADLVYTMEKRGERVGLVARTVRWNEAQRVILEAGRLSDEEEIHFLVDWLSTRRVLTGDSVQVIGLLAEKRGPEAEPAIIARLEQMGHGGGAANHIAYKALFEVLERSGSSPRAMAAVASFRDDTDGRVRQSADQAYDAMERAAEAGSLPDAKSVE